MARRLRSLRVVAAVSCLACGGSPATVPATAEAPALEAPTPEAPAVEEPAPGENAFDTTAATSASLSAEALEAHVRALTAPSMRGRGGGTAEEARAADYIAGQLAAFGLAPLAGDFVRPVPLRGGGASCNVVGVVRGSGEGWVVVGAHLDHLGVVDGQVHHGADDNASGVALVLEIARATVEAERSVAFAFFGGEELGLVGSRHFVREAAIPREAIDVMVNVDMVGRRLADIPGAGIVKRLAGIDDGRAIGMVGTAARPWLREIVKTAFRDRDLEAWGSEDLPDAIGGAIARVAADRSDHAPFEAVGIPTVFFSSGVHPDYHLPSDTPDKLDYRLMASRAQAIAAVVAALAKAAIPAAGG